MLDSRVAHNIVRENLPLFAKEPEVVIARAFNITFGEIDKIRRRGGLTSRDLRRHVERRVLPTLKTRGYSAWLDDVDEAPVLHCVATAGNATQGLLAVGFGMRLTDGQCFEKSLVSITPHAIARFLQRTDTVDFKTVIASIEVALCIAQSLRSSFLRAGCRQVGIPAGDGLFVGEFKEQVQEAISPRAPHSTVDLRGESVRDSKQLYLELSTWFIPCANGRETPWRKVKAYYGMKLRKLDHLPLTELCDEVRQTASRIVTSPTIAECFPFLQKPHTRRTDALETTWNLARRQAAQPERAALAA
jgi:hypothetical protein